MQQNVVTDVNALSKASEPFDFANPQCDPVQLVQDLKDTMIAQRGIGLSACQIGVPYNVFVVGDPNDPDNIVEMFNPRIVYVDSQETLIEEGCLSFPGMFIKIKRPTTIRIRYSDMNGNVKTEMYDGIPARVILHEFDHLQGTVFTQKATRLQLDRAKTQKVKLDKIRARNMK